MDATFFPCMLFRGRVRVGLQNAARRPFGQQWAESAQPPSWPSRGWLMPLVVFLFGAF
jgi:hypothetical protein